MLEVTWIWIRTSNTNRFRLGGGLRSLSALVIIVIIIVVVVVVVVVVDKMVVWL